MAFAPAADASVAVAQVTAPSVAVATVCAAVAVIDAAAPTAAVSQLARLCSNAGTTGWT